MLEKTEEEKIFSLWEILFSGGVLGNTIMVLIFLLGVLALYIFLERYFFIRKEGKFDAIFINDIKDLVHGGQLPSAIDLCRRMDSPQARMIEKGLSRMGRPIADITNAMQNQGQIEVSRLEKNMSILASVSGAAPMLGFLGTVVGMIMVFFEISSFTGAISPKLLASGIYTAMATTAVGLTVGIPAYFFYNILVTKVDRFTSRMQLCANEFLDSVSKSL